MRTTLKLIIYRLAAKYVELKHVFGFWDDALVIPRGYYCYSIDAERNKAEPINGGYWVKRCKYYRSTSKTKGVACLYLGYYGFDPCLYDQCKICGVNEE